MHPPLEFERSAHLPGERQQSSGRALPASRQTTAPLSAKERLRADILQGAVFYDKHHQHNAAARAREIAAGLDTLSG